MQRKLVDSRSQLKLRLLKAVEKMDLGTKLHHASTHKEILMMKLIFSQKVHLDLYLLYLVLFNIMMNLIMYEANQSYSHPQVNHQNSKHHQLICSKEVLMIYMLRRRRKLKGRVGFLRMAQTTMLTTHIQKVKWKILKI